jgi:hypothetical protein
VALQESTEHALVGLGERRLVEAPVERDALFLEDRVHRRQSPHLALRRSLGGHRVLMGGPSFDRVAGGAQVAAARHARALGVGDVVVGELRVLLKDLVLLPQAAELVM